MDDRQVPADLAALPKAEVHIHLEGTIRPATLDELCRRRGLTVRRQFSDLNAFIQTISGALARRRGLRSAPHAGEDAGPASVRGALDALGAERIQHGVRSVEDPALVAELAARGIPLAVCPTSNLRLGVVPSLEVHPLRRLWEAGVRVSVNTDDPGFFGCDLVGEYAIAGRLLGLDRAGYARLARNSVESSFAPEAVKADPRAAIAEWV